MATSIIGTQQRAYGIGQGLQPIPPFTIVAQRAPTTSDRANIGTFWIFTTSNDCYVLVSINNGISNWVSFNQGGAGIFSSLQINGPSEFNGNILQQAPGVTATLLATTTAGLTNNGNFVNNTGAVTINAPAAPGTAALTVNGQNVINVPSASFVANVAGMFESVQFLNSNNANTGSTEISVITTNQDAGAGRIGDAQIRFADTVFGEFTLGRDASANDFVISGGGALGTDNRLTISGATGAVNLPEQPCFVLILDNNGGVGAYTNVTGNANIWDIGNPLLPILNGGPSTYNVVVNNGAGALNANGQYVIPQAGQYLFTVGVRLSNVPTATGCQLRLVKNATIIGAVENNCNVSGTGFLLLSTSNIVECAQNDVIYAQIQVTGMAGNTASVNSDGASYLGTYLTGALLN